MRAPRPRRDREHGNSLLLAMIVMSSLATLGTLTVVSVQSSLKASTNDRSQTVAMYAAESGATAAMDLLRANPHNWTTLLGNATPPVLGNNLQPGMTGNPFSADMNAWYSVVILNNRNQLLPTDPPAQDTDDQVIIQSTGHGPQGSLAVVEWEVRLSPVPFPPARLVLVGWRTVL